MSKIRFKAALCASAALTVSMAAAVAHAQDADAVEEVVVTGTRDASRTPFTTLAPVDVLNAQTLQASATAQLGENLAQQIPSFIVQKLPTSDGLQFIRPATLRNLSPDQTLVLINGKRFHRSAFLGSRGAQGPDLAQIPTTAVGRMEVLRDGASAQYGSDAIAGVINILLDDKPGFSAFAQSGQFYEGDGETWRVGGRAGFAFEGGGFASFTAELSDQGLTSRSRQRQDAIDFEKATGIKVTNPVQRWGNPEQTTHALAANIAIPVGRAEAYALSTYTSTEGFNDINWRNPLQNPAIYRQTAVFPGFDLNTIYPAGFTPSEGIKARDFQSVAGVRLKDSDVFTWDASVSRGQNSSRFFLNNSINASLGPQSPRNFYLGQLQQTETNVNLDGVWRVPLGMAEPLNVAFGAETRTENYQIKVGDPASYAVGPGAAAGLAPNSNGFPGFAASQAGDWDQKSYAGYLDLEAQVTEKFSLGGAVRYEDFSEFGDTWNGKVAGRYAFSDNFAVRASYSTGFRAPTPGQLNSTSTSQGLDTVTLQLFTSGRLSPVSPVATFLGAKPLQPEESDTFTAGLVWRATESGFSGSIDAYRINVDKRFSTSATITVTPAIRAQLIAQGVPGADSFTSINWFTNDFDTTTSGVDAVINYVHDLGPGRIALMGAYNYNKTEVGSGSLSSNPTQKLLFESSRPKQNFTSSATYTQGPIELMARARYYGEWTDSTGNATGEIFQSFGAITLVDIAATWNINTNVSLRVGAENVLDTYPDEAVFQASRGLVYSRNAPYDTNGGQYYARVNLRF